MLRLEKLALRGFKSFCEPTEIVFHEGITAVVGPNGCGKSNILDSIAWVLGEQSARSLRGGKMDDVIFNGTRDRKPLGLAEVTLTLIAVADIVTRETGVEDLQIDPQLELTEFTEANLEAGNESGNEQNPESGSETGAIAQPDTGQPANIQAVTDNVVPATVVEDATEENQTTAGANKKKGRSAQGALKRALGAKHRLPNIAAGERVSISRRLYRSGESEYLMNGHICRLRDIHDFFAGTGLGGAQYAIIEQGHIGQILSSKPQERRGLIEEAAGITKFKAKKHLAELKLEATRQNLSRLNDIISEVDRQLVTLKRQAAKARRYRRLREQMRAYLRFLFTAEYDRIQEALANADQQLTKVRDREQICTQQLNEKEQSHRQTQNSLRNKEVALEETRVNATNLEIEVERTRNRITYQEAQQKEIAVRSTDFQRELAATGERAQLVEKELARRRQDLAKINQELSQAELELKTQESGQKSQQDELTAAEKELDAIRNQLLTEVSKTERLRHMKHQLEDNLKRIQLRQQNLKHETSRAEERRDTCEHNHERLRTELNLRISRIETLSDQFADINERLEGESRSLKQEQHNLTDLARESARTEDRLASLVELDEQRAYFSEAVQHLLADKQARRDFHLLGTLADFLEVAPANEQLVERILGDRLQAILLPTIDDALAANQWLATNQAGRATFLITGLHGGADGASLADAQTTNDHAAKNISLLELLGLKAAHEQLFKRAFPDLAGAMVADDLKAALELSAQSPQQMIVTPLGEHVRACSLMITANSASSGTSVLQLKREIKELTSRTVVLQEQHEKAANTLNVRKDRISQLEAQRRELDIQLRGEEKQLAAQRVELTQSEKEFERAKQHVRVVNTEAQQTSSEFSQQETKLEPIIGELTRAEEMRRSIEERVEEVRANIGRLKPIVEELSQALAEMRANTAAKLERRRAAAGDVRRLEEEQGQLARRSERDKFELTQLETRTQELATSLKQAQVEIVDLERTLVRSRALVEATETELAEVRAVVDRLEIDLAKLRTEITTLRETRSQVEIETARLQTDAQHLETSCRNELSESLETVVQRAKDPENFVETSDDEEFAGEEKGRSYQIDKDLTVDTAAQVLNELRVKLDELGPVNMMALDELTETEKRRTFLQQQFQDISQSITATEEVLREIKKRSRTRFKEAFEQINKNFSEVFQELFGGGRGEMMLIDEEDVLESGIDIIAQPPGKRLQSVLLLSGGEKAMTAMSLLLGIFRYRPSPFCVLDEVDAPLDDVNIGRFTNKVVDMTSQTQFLIITHSKRTMEVASSIYGVTMQEPGISKVVSVRFDK